MLCASPVCVTPIKVSSHETQPRLFSKFHSLARTTRVNSISTPYPSFRIVAQSQLLQGTRTRETQKQNAKNLLPVIDFTRKDLIPGTSCWVSTGKEVMDALEKYGCFEAVYDKAVPVELQRSMYTALDQLFDLPEEAKTRIGGDIPYFGYHPNDSSRVLPLYDGVGFLDAATLDGTQKFTKKLWPQGNDFFCKTTLAYSERVAKLEQMIMEMVFEGYGVGQYDLHKESTTYMFRMAKYRLPTEKDKSNIGIGVHNDKTFISILGQHQIGGLVIRTKSRQWTSVEPSTSSLVVLAGEALTAWSNDRIPAPFHKVIMEGDKERYSLGLFSFHKGIVEIPQELISEEHPPKYKPFNNLEFMRYFYSDSGRRNFFTLKAFCGV